jgi:hypothetical protein
LSLSSKPTLNLTPYIKIPSSNFTLARLAKNLKFDVQNNVF